jgi:aarF domain-containing kinase
MGNSDSRLAKQSNKENNASGKEKEESVHKMVERLEKDIEILSARCARLEAQNILVPVQQLDMLARGTALLLSTLSLYLYWKCLCWTMAQLPVTVKTFLPLGQEWMDYVLHPLSLTMFKCILAVVPYLYNRMTYGSVHRRFEVFTVAFIVIARVKMTRWRERMFTVDPACCGVSKYGHDTNEDAIWDANYEISARFLYVSILRLRGLWTKSAQYLSSRADFMPESYVRELKKLQDEAPMTEWKDVQRILAKAPGLMKELTDISKTPIASASIGQVHTARLRSTGEKVVFKVQHPHARTLLMDDFWSLRVIARLVTWMDPEYAFFEILMREWAVEARKELDFLTEADNLKAAQASIDVLLENEKAVVYSNPTPTCQQAVPFQVEIPQPLLHLTTNDVLVMSFCEGTRVDDLEQIQKWGLPREAIMNGVAQTFSHMMYATSPNMFNADPHPGNIFVRPGTHASRTEGFTIVLLDWGLAKRMPEDKRIAFCQMAYAASTFDYGMLLDAFRRVGLKMKRENVAEDMESMRFYLRDMAPSSKQRKRIKAKIKTDRVSAWISYHLYGCDSCH